MPTFEYLELLDWTARQARRGKRGKTPADAPPVVGRLGLSAESWTELVGSFGRLFHEVAGRPDLIDGLRSHHTARRFHVRPRVRALMPASDL